MAPIPNVGLVFPTGAQFLDYLEGIKFGAWRPRYVTVHHTGAPDLKTWRGWQTRANPISDAQWLKNLAAYYGNNLGWRSGPQFFFTPNNFCVLSPPTKPGVHAVSFNAASWGVEMVGNFDTEPFDGAIRDKYVEGLACLHLATGLPLEPVKFNEQGLHFHRDDPKTSKTCPGRKVDKTALIIAVRHKMAQMSGDGDHPDEVVQPVTPPAAKTGTVNVPANDTLNVRADASAKSPVLTSLKPGASVSITGEAMNGTTKWLKVDLPGEKDGWVSAAFVRL